MPEITVFILVTINSVLFSSIIAFFLKWDLSSYLFNNKNNISLIMHVEIVIRSHIPVKSISKNRSNFSKWASAMGLRGSAKCLAVRVFEGRNEILLLGKTPKFGVIFQKYALKSIKIWIIIGKIRGKMQHFLFFYFMRDHTLFNMGKIRKIVWTHYNEGSEAEPPNGEMSFGGSANVSRTFSKSVIKN